MILKLWHFVTAVVNDLLEVNKNLILEVSYLEILVIGSFPIFCI